jgi:K+-sensing histidine kinase KdpD
MRLSDFIRQNNQPIISEWESFARTLTPAADDMSRLQLRDHIEQILSFIATDIESEQSQAQQIKKSHGDADSQGSRDTAAETHASLRHEEGFDIVQMVSEYRALRASIIKLWSASKGAMTTADCLDITRCNESIDQALTESVTRFMEKVDYSKDVLLGVLGHDIRSPLGAITMTASLLPKIGDLNEKQILLVSQIAVCALRVNKIVTDLLDLTRARMGTKLPITPKSMNIEILAKQMVDEISIQHPDRSILLETSGDMSGEWDDTRMGQVFTNLISNAIQYGTKALPINIKVAGGEKEVVITVHNSGEPISAKNLGVIFNSFSRGNSNESNGFASNLGLGLFIAKEIVHSHKGVISAASDEAAGTTFTINLPRLSNS